MQPAEHIALIQDGIVTRGGTWADFGAGWGNFTRALRHCVGETAVIYAIDEDASVFTHLKATHGKIGALHTLHADITQPLPLPPLDGVLMANALHFIEDQAALLQRIRRYLRPMGRLLIVEYDTATPRAWIPYPVPPARFHALATAAGFVHNQAISQRQSPTNHSIMYAAVCINPS